MKYDYFEHILSPSRMQRYLLACGNDKRKAMDLYRFNMRLAHEMFSVISMFELSLRNAIDAELRNRYGNQWLIDAMSPISGRLSKNSTRNTYGIIMNALIKMPDVRRTQDCLIAELEFGVWRYFFAQPQYAAMGHCLMNIFPQLSSYRAGYTYSQVYNDLDGINRVRNRIAHHEPICFDQGTVVINTTFIRDQYRLIKEIFSWMNIDATQLLYGLDHVEQICDKIDKI